MALALLGLGEAAPGAFPVRVSIEGHGATLDVTVEGQSHAVVSTLGPGWRGLALEEPGPLDREYQVDGSDTTSTGDRQPRVLRELLDTPLYRLDAWLRDEGSYSRWQGVRVMDLGTGALVPTSAGLPRDFRIEAALRRPEAAARLWLLGPGEGREGLELDRDRRNARWVIERGGARQPLPRWFFPEDPWPFAAELMNLVGRAAAAGAALLVCATVLGALSRRAVVARAGSPAGGQRDFPQRGDAARLAAVRTPAGGRPVLLPRALRDARVAARIETVGNLVLAGWLLGAVLVTVRLYHQLPHILDAVAYSFQARIFATGRLALPAPPDGAAFRGPFEVVSHNKLFAQYPPGAPLAYALGQAVSLEWLVGPLACLLLIAATGWTAGALYGQRCGLAVVALGALSPFILFQAGSFLSHPVAAGVLAAALAAFVKAERESRPRWYALSGALLGFGFLTREAASVLFALPLAARLLTTRRVAAALTMCAWGLPFVLLYLLYNLAQTGSATVLPRTLFDAADHFGFGDGVGFHTRHTLAAGLANTDELLTLLQFDLFGWPPLFAPALLAVVWLGGRVAAWDRLAALGALAFVVAYVGYFYHGIALGPRYYFEAMPWFLLLAARGAQAMAYAARSRLAAILVLGALSVNTALVYLPLEVQRRTNLSAQPGGRQISLTFVDTGLLGPHLRNVPGGSLVVTADWWLFNTGLSALNCARLPECDVLFALAPSDADGEALRAAYPDRTLLRARDTDGLIDLVDARLR